MKKYMLVLLMLCSFSLSFSQKVNLIKVDQLFKRVKNESDTIYVVNFWATWCVPCLKELPEFEKVQAENKNKNIKILLVNVDFKSRLKKAIIPFVKKHHLKSEVFLLDEDNQQVYIDLISPSWTGSLPATLFIHKNKTMFLEQEFSYQQINQQLKNIQ